MGTKNYNVRFRENKADEERAWERLHSEGYYSHKKL